MKHQLLLRTALLTSLLTVSVIPAAYAEANTPDGAGEGVNVTTDAVRCKDCPEPAVTCTCGVSEEANTTELEPNRTVQEATESTGSEKAQNPAGTKDGSYF